MVDSHQKAIDRLGAPTEPKSEYTHEEIHLRMLNLISCFSLRKHVPIPEAGINII